MTHRDASDVSHLLAENIMTFHLKMPNNLSNSRRLDPLAQQSITYSSSVYTATAFSSCDHSDSISLLPLVSSSSSIKQLPISLPSTRNNKHSLVPQNPDRNGHIMIYLPIMHLKLEPDEIRQDGGAARLRFDWDCTLA